MFGIQKTGAMQTVNLASAFLQPRDVQNSESKNWLSSHESEFELN